MLPFERMGSKLDNMLSRREGRRSPQSEHVMVDVRSLVPFAEDEGQPLTTPGGNGELGPRARPDDMPVDSTTKGLTFEFLLIEPGQ